MRMTSSLKQMRGLLTIKAIPIRTIRSNICSRGITSTRLPSTVTVSASAVIPMRATGSCWHMATPPVRPDRPRLEGHVEPRHPGGAGQRHARGGDLLKDMFPPLGT